MKHFLVNSVSPSLFLKASSLTLLDIYKLLYRKNVASLSFLLFRFFQPDFYKFLKFYQK